MSKEAPANWHMLDFEVSERGLMSIQESLRRLNEAFQELVAT